MPTTTNYGWTTPADTDLVKDGAAAIRTLGNGIDTSLVDLKGGTTGQYLKKNSNTDLDYVWGDVSAGGMTLISEQTASALSSLSFSSLGSYKQLLLVWFGISHNVTGSTFAIRFNNSSGNNYYHGGMTASSAGTITAFSNTATSLYASQSGQSAYPFGQDAYSTYAPYGLSGSLLIDNYGSSTKNKFYQGHWYYQNENETYRYIADIQGSWNDTSAITSIDIVRLTGSATFSNTANSQIRLYGVS